MSHILILEPDNLIAGSLKRYFANANHSVAAHSDPQQAVMAADQQIPDIVITELQLAGRSGVEFLYEFRSYPDWQTIPIIIYTDLQPQHIAAYKEVLSELNVSICLRKSLVGMDQLLEHIGRTLAARV